MKTTVNDFLFFPTFLQIGIHSALQNSFASQAKPYKCRHYWLSFQNELKTRKLPNRFKKGKNFLVMIIFTCKVRPDSNWWFCNLISYI